jgi:hypothetical protein
MVQGYQLLRRPHLVELVLGIVEDFQDYLFAQLVPQQLYLILARLVLLYEK